MRLLKGLIVAVALIAVVLAGATSVVYYQQLDQLPAGSQDAVFALTHQRLPAMCLAPAAQAFPVANGSEL